MRIKEFFKKRKPEIYYTPEYHKAILRCSICTGEQIFGFKDRKTGHFTEVAKIENQKDLELFKKLYGIEEELEKEY